MGSKYDDFKRDLDTLFKITRDNEEKCRNEVKKVEDRVSSIDKDYIEINGTLKNLSQNLKGFIGTFEKHDESEMKKYDNINESIKKLDKKVQETLNMKDDVKALQETQKKAIKYFWIGSGVLLGLSGLISLGVFILDLISKMNKAGIPIGG